MFFNRLNFTFLDEAKDDWLLMTEEFLSIIMFLDDIFNMLFGFLSNMPFPLPISFLKCFLFLRKTVSF